MTGQEIVTGALELIGAWAPADGAVNAADSDRALFHLNLLRKSWNAKSLALHTVARATFTWPVSTTTRTIGAAGQLVGTRPLQILAAKVIPVGQTAEVDVDVISHAAYAGISDKTQTSTYFRRLMYEPDGAATGTLTVWPVPTSAPTLVLHHKSLLAAIALTDAITCPEVYEAALVTQLAKRLAPVFGKPWTRELEDIAREDWATVLRANVRIPEETCMPAGFPGQGRGGVSMSDYDAGNF
jgi:hypothetical protein